MLPLYVLISVNVIGATFNITWLAKQSFKHISQISDQIYTYTLVSSLQLIRGVPCCNDNCCTGSLHNENWPTISTTHFSAMN